MKGGSSTMDVPSRDDVADLWERLVRGEISREQVHEWAKPWVEERDDEVSDALVRTALLRLHGFDMIFVDENRKVVRHGGQGSGSYVHSAQAIADAFDQWVSKSRDS